MVIYILLALNLVFLVAIALIQRKHMRWVRWEFHRNAMAHNRMASQLPVKRTPVQPIPPPIPDPNPEPFWSRAMTIQRDRGILQG